ncbi:TetR/AcrR family transcriptional regulator [Thalassolituus sp. LLYu03]|uniref:TetR/AcrR family transcriptional regulator n=1 Tax=Thalassolituus sp. LLYu03 TaxID=3421656 RepID=UPI003D28D01D
MSDTRQQLKQIATEQIRRHTLHAASFREMGKVLGIKSSSVHYHFDNRDALLQELVSDYEHAFFAQLEARCAGVSSPLQQLAGLFIDSHQQQQQCLCLAFAAAGDETTAEQRQAVQRFLQRLEDWVADTLARAHLLPLARPELARVIVSSLEGALLLDRDQPQPLRLEATRQWLSTLTRL